MKSRFFIFLAIISIGCFLSFYISSYSSSIYEYDDEDENKNDLNTTTEPTTTVESTEEDALETTTTSRYGKFSMLISPFVPFRSTFVGSPKYKIAACRIQKNLSTILLNLFCYLNTPVKFRKKAHSLTSEFDGNLSSLTCNSSHTTDVFSNSVYELKWAIIRDPVERFLSAFVDKCLHEARYVPRRCYGCGNSILCVLQKQYFRFLKISQGLLTNYTYEDRHFAPMTWFCDFNKENLNDFKYFYFGETEKQQSQTILDIINGFKKRGVNDETIKLFTKQLTQNRTKHSTSGSSIRETAGRTMRGNENIMEYLYLIYENDYRVFNLTSPFKTNYGY